MLDQLESEIVEEVTLIPSATERYATWNGSMYVVPKQMYYFSEAALCVIRGCYYARKGNAAAAMLEVRRALKRLIDYKLDKAFVKVFFFVFLGCAVVSVSDFLL